MESWRFGFVATGGPVFGACFCPWLGLACVSCVSFQHAEAFCAKDHLADSPDGAVLGTLTFT